MLLAKVKLPSLVMHEDTHAVQPGVELRPTLLQPFRLFGAGVASFISHIVVLLAPRVRLVSAMVTDGQQH